jgi:hypothetical protein
MSAIPVVPHEDIQGIIACIITGGTMVLEGIAMFKGVDPMQILQIDIGILGSIVGFYFGVKSQQ